MRDEIGALEPGDPVHLVQKLIRGAMILSGRRLIQDQGRWLEGQGDGERQALLLPE